MLPVAAAVGNKADCNRTQRHFSSDKHSLFCRVIIVLCDRSRSNIFSSAESGSLTERLHLTVVLLDTDVPHCNSWQVQELCRVCGADPSFLWPVEGTQRFCCPQQLTDAISDHKGCCQRDTLFVFVTHPSKEAASEVNQSESGTEAERLEGSAGNAARVTEHTVSKSRGIPTITPQSIIIIISQLRAKRPPLPLLPPISSLSLYQI